MAIEALDIEIKSNADGANNAVEHLIGSLGKLSGILQQIGSAVKVPLKASEALGGVAKASSAVASGASRAVSAVKQQSASLQALQLQYDQVRRRIDLYQGIVNRSKAWGEKNGETEDNINTRIQAIEKLQELTKRRYDLEMQLQSATAASAGAEKQAAEATEQHAEAQKKLLPLLSSTKGVTKALDKAFGGMRKTLKAMGRMVFMRAIRAAIRMVTSNVKEGVKNLAEFDKATGQVTSVGAIQTLSAYGQKFLELKNAVGAAAMPLMQTLLPVVQTITGWFIAAANAVNQLLRAIQGFSTFFAAGAADGYNYADSMNAAAGGASKLKNTLLGFDELNVMNDNSGGGGGGGSGNWGGLSAQDLFSEKQIGKFMLDFGTSLKLTIDDIFADWGNWNDEQVAEVIIAGAAAVLGGIIGFSIGGVGTALLGVAIGAAVGLSIDALVFNHDGSIDKNEAGNIVLTAVAALLGGTVGFLIGGGVMGVAVGAAVGLTIVLADLIVRKSRTDRLIDQFYETPEGKEFKALKASIEETASFVAEIKININERKETREALDSMEKQAGRILNELIGIQGAKILTPTQVSRVRTLMSQLNALGLDGLMSHYDEATGKINLTEDAIRKVIQAQIDQAKTTAYVKLYNEAIEDSVKIEMRLDRAIQDQQNAIIALARRREELTAAEALHENVLLREKQYAEDLMAAGVDADLAWEQAIRAFNGELGNTQAAVRAAKENVKAAEEAVNGAAGAVKDLRGEWNEVNGEVDYYQGKVNKLEGTRLTVELDAKMPTLPKSVRTTLLFTPKLERNTVTVAISGQNVKPQNTTITFTPPPGYAEGGFPAPGLFLANEAGPELVGTIGGRTAVANSDQIIAGIASGVAAAMAGTGEKLDRANDLLQGIAEKDATVTVSTADIAAGMVRMNRRAGATVMPVGA